MIRSANIGSISDMKQTRFIASAASKVLPLPPNKSKIASPGFEHRLIGRSCSVTGFCVLC